MKFAALVLVIAHLVGGGAGFFAGDAVPERMYPIGMDLKGHELTTITVTGHGQGDMDCYLYKGSFRTHDAVFVTRDTSNANGCTLTVNPESDAHMTLLVQNTGEKPQHYTVVVQ